MLFAAMAVVEEEHRLVTLGRLLDGGLQIDPIEQPAQPQVDHADFVSRRARLVVSFSGLSSDSAASFFLRKLIKATLAVSR